MSATRFRRARLARWADAETLDRLEADWLALSPEEQAERNVFIDERSDAEIRAFLGQETDEDRKATRARKRAAAKKTTAPPPEVDDAGGESDADASDGGGQAEG